MYKYAYIDIINFHWTLSIFKQLFQDSLNRSGNNSFSLFAISIGIQRSVLCKVEALLSYWSNYPPRSDDRIRKHGVLEIFLFFIYSTCRFVTKNGCNRGTTILFLLWKPWTKTSIQSSELFLVSNELLLYARRDRCNIWESETVNRCISGLSKIHQLSDVLYLCPVPKQVLQVRETDGMRGILWWLVRGMQLGHSEGCRDQGFVQQRKSVL